MAWTDICSEEDVFEGRLNGFEAEGRRVLVLRNGKHLVAFDGTCTHEDADLSFGFLRAGRITCPLHLSQFDAQTGEVYNPPAERGLAKFPVKVEGGRVLVDVQV